MGAQWASSVIGIVAALLAPIPFIFLKYGARIRERSRFAPCNDIEIAKELAAATKKAEREKEPV